MTTTSTKDAKANTDHQSYLDSDLSLDFLRVVEQAAIACAHTMGQGDRHKSDQVAVEAMRREMDSVPIGPVKPGDDTQRRPDVPEAPTGLALWPTFLRRSLPSEALEPGQRQEKSPARPVGAEAG